MQKSLLQPQSSPLCTFLCEIDSNSFTEITYIFLLVSKNKYVNSFKPLNGVIVHTMFYNQQFLFNSVS